MSASCSAWRSPAWPATTPTGIGCWTCAGITDTLIGDADGVYHPASFNDRLVLGLKGTMSEAELHVLRARLEGGIRNKAARGELRRGLPVGLVWGDEDGEILLHPDEAVRGVIAAVFERFAEFGSVRAVWLWLLRRGTASFPLQRSRRRRARPGSTPTYNGGPPRAHPPFLRWRLCVWAHPPRALRRRDGRVGQPGPPAARGRADWQVLIVDHHPGYIDWATFEANQARIGANTRPRAHEAGGARARRLRPAAGPGHLRVLRAAPDRALPRRQLEPRLSLRRPTTGRRPRRAPPLRRRRADRPGGDRRVPRRHRPRRRSQPPWPLPKRSRPTTTPRWPSAAAKVERARYHASRAERRYLAVDPDNRLVARGLEADWEQASPRWPPPKPNWPAVRRADPEPLSAEQRAAIVSLGTDLARVWSAPTTTDRDRKELLRTLLEEVVVASTREHRGRAHAALAWRGHHRARRRPSPLPPAPVRTDEDTIALLRRLAVHYPDATIAGILNRQGRRTATGQPFTATMSQACAPLADPPPPTARRPHPTASSSPSPKRPRASASSPPPCTAGSPTGSSPANSSPPAPPGVSASTTTCAPASSKTAPPGWLPMLEATHALGVTRQTVLQRVKRGELEAVHVRSGRRKGLRIKVNQPEPGLFDDHQQRSGQCDDRVEARRDVALQHPLVAEEAKQVTISAIASWARRFGRKP